MEYNEKSIRVLSKEELESHSAHSILEILLNENHDIAYEHLSRMSECLVILGYGVNEYREYRKGTLDNNKLETIKEWFRERNAKHKK